MVFIWNFVVSGLFKFSPINFIGKQITASVASACLMEMNVCLLWNKHSTGIGHGDLPSKALEHKYEVSRSVSSRNTKSYSPEIHLSH